MLHMRPSCQPKILVVVLNESGDHRDRVNRNRMYTVRDTFITAGFHHFMPAMFACRWHFGEQ